MNNFLIFIFGNLSGIYICQNYKIPNLKKVSENIIDYLEKFEKD